MLAVENLSKVYGQGATRVVALDGVELSAEAGEFVCIVGPSGCGKTTLLKCMAGLLPPSAGQVLLHGQPVVGPPPQMALVFQDYSRSLLPWRSVWANVALPLRAKRLPREQQHQLVAEALTSVGLQGFERHYPWQLSGGMQQRVAIARALAYQPEILLLDEPFASVDAQTRADLEDLLLRVWRNLGITALFVTHDIDESVYLADRVVILSAPPATKVKEILDIPLPRPRDQLATKELPEFARLRAQVYTSVKRTPAPASQVTIR
jgi:NitT/TauT family transport system ATP-binding protein